MPKYTVRVELHGADGETYRRLHDRMKAQNFLRTFNAGMDDFYLPTAEYSGAHDGLQAKDLAAKVRGWAEEVHPDVGVIATPGEFGYSGKFEPATVYHRKTSVPAVAGCGAHAPAERLRPSELDAEDQIRINPVGEFCPRCFPGR